MAEKGPAGEGSSASNTGKFLSRFKNVSAYSSASIACVGARIKMYHWLRTTTVLIEWPSMQ